MKIKERVGDFLMWRSRNINDRYFVVILSVIIGIFAGLASYVLKSSVYFIEKQLTGDFATTHQNYWYFLFPAIGIFLTWLFLKYVIRDNTHHGIPRILFVISKLGGKMKRTKVFSSIVGSSFTAGFGGSIGLEAPIIAAGSSLGSGLAHVLRLNYKMTILLIGCGAAGAMAAIFTTPVAAVIFSLEVLLLDLTISSIIPLLMSSAVGAITAKLLMSEDILIRFEVIDPFYIEDIPYYLLLGVFTGFVSLYFNKITYLVSEKMEYIKNDFAKVLIGGAILGVLIFIFPPLYGEGYDAIKMIIQGNPEGLMTFTYLYDLRTSIWFLLGFILLLILVKVVATSLTISSGGVGGIFAPSAVTGGFAGFFFVRVLKELNIVHNLSESNFILVGMAAVLGAVLHAPLTAIFLIMEMTNGYELIVPLMLTTTIAFVTIKTFDPHSIFTKRLAERGELLTHHKDKAVLTLMTLKDVIDKDIVTLSPDATLGDLTRVIARSKRNLFPVVDKNMTFLGLVILDDVREDMFVTEYYKRSVAEYFFPVGPNDKVNLSDSMESVLEKFNVSGNYNLIVLDQDKYVGMVSRANVFNAYRKTLMDVSHE